MGGTRESENAETLDNIGLVQQCLAYGCDWQYPLTVNENPEVAKRVQELWRPWQTKRDFGMNDQDWRMPLALRGDYEAAIYDFIARLPLPFDRPTNQFRARGPDDGESYQDEYRRLLGTVDADLQDQTSLAHQLGNRIVHDYANNFPLLNHVDFANNPVAVVKKLVHMAGSAYGQQLCDQKTLKQFFTSQGPVSKDYEAYALGHLEIEFECKPEMSCEEPVSGIYLGWPVRLIESQWEFFRFTIVRQVKRWKIVLNNNNINRLLAQPEELLKAKELMNRLSKLRPMFVAQGKSYEYNGIDDNPLTAGAGHHETEHCNLISFLPEPLAGNRVPLNRYLLVRNHELLTSPWFEGFMDCKASKQRWRDLNQKRQLCSAWEKVRSDTYAPGKPGADRDMDEYDEIVRGEIPKAFERRAEELRAEREREMERERPPFLRDRDRSRSRSRSRLGAHLAGGVPNLARLKL